jgi:putative redox protein
MTDQTSPAAAKKVAMCDLQWSGERRFDLTGAGGGTVTIGGGVGPGPVETLLGALAACTCYDVLDILDKRRTPPTGIRVETRGDRAAAVPARLENASLVYHIEGADIAPEHAVRAVQLSVEKYCSVKNSLDPAMPVTWRVFLNGTDVTP